MDFWSKIAPFLDCVEKDNRETKGSMKERGMITAPSLISGNNNVRGQKDKEAAYCGKHTKVILISCHLNERKWQEL